MGLILVRYGEIGLKGRNRGEFIKKLQFNIETCLKEENISGRVERLGRRLYVQAEEVEAALDALSRVFGIVSLSPVVRMPANMEGMKAEGLRVARESDLTPDKSFRVRSRRADKTFDLISPEIDTAVGGFVKESTGARVDLSDDADLTVEIEVLEGEVLVYSQRVAGPGGLPLGSQGRVVALISGGIDSPVAAWMVMKRGCAVIPVHFFYSSGERQKMLDNCAVLSRHSYGWELHPVLEDHNDLLLGTFQRLKEIGAERWACIFCKRALTRRAEEIAQEVGAHAIVMGDSLGQVASQTLENIAAISYGMKMPLLRPLIGMDKTQIINLAKEIGTFDVSIRDTTPCPFLPRHPVTRANMAKFRGILDSLGEG